MGYPAQGVRQTTDQSGSDPREAGGDDRPHGVSAGVAGERDISDVQHAVQGAGTEARGPDRVLEDVQHAQRAADGGGCGADIWWAGGHAERDGQVHRACEFLFLFFLEVSLTDCCLIQ